MNTRSSQLITACFSLAAMALTMQVGQHSSDLELLTSKALKLDADKDVLSSHVRRRCKPLSRSSFLLCGVPNSGFGCGACLL